MRIGAQIVVAGFGSAAEYDPISLLAPQRVEGIRGHRRSCQALGSNTPTRRLPQPAGPASLAIKFAQKWTF